MGNYRRYRYLAAGLLVVTSLSVSYGLGHYFAHPNPKQVTIHVSGPLGAQVSGTFDVDGVSQCNSEAAALPAQFSCTGHRVAFTVRQVGGPEGPIAAAVDIDGIRRGVGTAAGGVRVGIWGGPAGAKPGFSAVAAEPEWKQTEEAGPRPNLIGTRPPEWTPLEWINSEPLRLAELRGKVVLVRWFTGPVCEYCVATAPALREFHERYSGRGLAVVGMFYHADSTLEEVRDIVEQYGFLFPVAIDRGAKTRRLWCLGRYDYGYTSVTFLLDRDGVIRYIHPGGQYVKGDADFLTLESEIERLLGQVPGKEGSR